MKIRVEEETNVRIDKYLTQFVEDSRSLIDKKIEAGLVTVNGEEVSTHYIPRVDDEIEISEVNPTQETIESEEMPLDIVYEDDDVIIINKPSGMVVHPGAGNFSGTLVNGLMHYTKDLSDVNGDIRPGIVHRIDKDTTGIMIVAKNNKAHEILSDALSRHEIKRDYIALLRGEFPSDTATVDAPIGRDPSNRKKMAVTSRNSKDAITHVRVIKRYKGYTLVRCSLETGRTHQIRVHMAYTGYPIVNDPLYGIGPSDSFGQFLHSTSIDFTHPMTKEHMHFEVDLPEHFKEFLNTLEEK
ncbi:MAG: RluA family pseudouridine synthase [Bacilli bacterium]|nr:RluA family pseudouridine synthase [Bacilli bacterium]